VTEAVNDTLKAIAASLLMEQVRRELCAWHTFSELLKGCQILVNSPELDIVGQPEKEAP